MHANRRRILTLLVLGLAAGSPLSAQEAARPQGAGRGAVKAPATGTPKKAAAPSDPAARKAAVQTDGALSRIEDENPAAVREMEKLLAAWESKSAIIKTLSVSYKRVDISPVFGTRKEYEGQAKFTSDNKAYLDFYEINEGKPKSFDERIVCDGEKVYQFTGATKQINIFPLPADKRQKALQQGPLPFLFNMKAAEAKQRYKMILKREDAESYQILIIPLLEIDREEYSQAIIRLDKKRLIPTGVHLAAPNGKDTKTFTFKPTDLAENVVIPAKWFDGVGMVSTHSKTGWKVMPGPDEQTKAASAVGARPAPAAARPAMKGQAGGVRQK